MYADDIVEYFHFMDNLFRMVQGRCLIGLILLALGICGANPTIVATFIVRDEDVNLKVNLPLWATFVDYFVFMVDSRTKDNSITTIKDILHRYNRPHYIQNYEFKGFGMARTLSLNHAWNFFSNATHVLIADPDWRPELNTLSKSELDDSHDVFRFTVFDRNGATRRRMDWLLRNRQGLRMRYRLHEVLDIGLYSVKEITWKIHEIEQFGSWHASVGHGNSMSIARLNFDLHLLLDDLVEYGIDPHTHYYLGTTFHGVAEKQFLEEGLYNETAIENSIKYLMLRLSSNYSAEFFEERWGCMYVLGAIYGSIKKEYPSAITWMSMCRDFNPNQVECGLSLARYYYYHGMVDKAFIELEKILIRGHEDRIMLNMLRTKDCSVPELVIDLFTQKAKIGALTIGDAKFMLLMVNMVENPICNSNYSLRSEVWKTISPVLAHQSDFSVQETSSGENLCGQPDLQSYLATKQYRIHPCDQFQIMFDVQRNCMLMSNNLPPANEELQLSIGSNAFIGAANIPDIIHHVWRGDLTRITRHTSSDPFKILFAEYFHPKMVESVLGYFHRAQFPHYRISIVLNSPQSILTVQESIQYCGKLSGIAGISNHIEYIESDLTDFLKGLIDQNKNSINGKHEFDYIEFNGGLSKSPDYSKQLQYFQELLSKDGVLGLTYFTKNKHEIAIRNQLRLSNPSAFKPFSYEAKRFIQVYLETHGMDFLTKDEELIMFLGGEPAQRKYPASSVTDLVPPHNWTSFSREEVIRALTTSKLSASAWVPTAYSHPYESIEHVSVKRFQYLGITEEDFIENYLTFFRYSLYAQKSSATDDPRCMTSTRLNANFFLNPSISKTVFVTDRLGSLGQSLSPLVDSAKAGHFGQLGFAPYSLNQKFVLDYTVSPLIAPSLAYLSQTPSLYDLVTVAVEFPHHRVRDHSNAGVIAKQLSDLLNFLSSINAITLLRHDGPLFECAQQQTSLDLNVLSTSAPLLSDLEIQAERMRELGFDEQFINEALLMRVEDQQPRSQNDIILETSSDSVFQEIDIKAKLSSILKILHEKTESLPTNERKVRTALHSIEKLHGVVGATNKNKSDTVENDHVEFLKKHADAAESILFNVKAPNIQSQRLYRSLLCFQSLHKGLKNLSCNQAKPVKRRTAAIQSSSYVKILFDIWIARNINETTSGLNPDIVTYLDALYHIKDYMEERGMVETRKCHRLVGTEITEKSMLLNHAIYVEDRFIPLNHTLLQWGALQQIKQVAEEYTLDRNDYVVLDILLQAKALNDLRKTLIASSIWYDATNGAAFASHFDDGLTTLPVFSSLAKQIALALSTKKKIQVNKFYVIALPPNFPANSPISLGNRNEIVGVLWLTGPALHESIGEDGLRVYDPLAADCLFGQGISFYPSVHPEFLSKGGDLAIDIVDRCNDYHWEHIHRVENRMVLIRDRMPFYFERTGAYNEPAIAVVMHFSVK